MPPRYAYWTIIVDDKPTAFRSGSQEELMPTFKRLKAKNDTAVMMWFQIGKLWPSRVAAQEFMHERSETGRKGDARQPGSGFRDRKSKPSGSERTAWTPRGEPSTPPPARNADEKLDWKPKGEFVPAPKRADRAEWKPRDEKPEWKPKGSFDRERKPDWKSKPSSPHAFKPSRSEKPEWKPKGSFDRERKAEWKPRTDRSERPQWSPKTQDPSPKSFKRPDFKSSGDDTRSAKPEWKPKGSFTPAPRRSGGMDWKSKPSSPSTYAKAPADRQAFKPSRSEKPEWKPKGSFDREERSDWKSKPAWKPKSEAEGRGPRRSAEREGGPAWKPRTDRSERPQWTPKSQDSNPEPQDPGPRTPEKRKWMPKEEYKKSMGIVAKRDSKWRPGGEHKDPKQKYKDAKKAKWAKFKENIRGRSGGKGKKSS